MATRARSFRFTIRTLLLVGLTVSLALGWWTERQSRSTLMEQNREIRAEFDRVKKVLARPPQTFTRPWPHRRTRKSALSLSTVSPNSLIT